MNYLTHTSVVYARLCGYVFLIPDIQALVLSPWFPKLSRSLRWHKITRIEADSGQVRRRHGLSRSVWQRAVASSECQSELRWSGDHGDQAHQTRRARIDTGHNSSVYVDVRRHPWF